MFDTFRELLLRHQKKPNHVDSVLASVSSMLILEGSIPCLSHSLAAQPLTALNRSISYTDEVYLSSTRFRIFFGMDKRLSDFMASSV